MLRILLLISLLLAIPAGFVPVMGTESVLPDTDNYVLYDEMGLEGLISFEAFAQAVEGYRKVSPGKHILALADFSKPSTAKRLFIIDMEQRKLLLDSYVSHGRNSGGNYATSFSNDVGSYKSSLGFYLTGGTYQGANGYSLLLDGLEQGINDKARQRAIVVHGADYCEPSVIASSGRLGRSFGCPALPRSVSRQIIDIIKDGALLYIYAASKDYLDHTTILSRS